MIIKSAKKIAVGSEGVAGFLIGDFAQKMFEHQSKNTAI